MTMFDAYGKLSCKLKMDIKDRTASHLCKDHNLIFMYFLPVRMD
jgi:hypothetical protein